MAFSPYAGASVTGAGVWTLLSLVLQILLDSTHLSVALMSKCRSSCGCGARFVMFRRYRKALD
jgi:hypothetical protein